MRSPSPRILVPVVLAALAHPACGWGGTAPSLVPEPSPASRPAASRAAPPSLPPVVTHSVQAGETLWRITQAYGADLEEVIVVNNLDAAARIQAGEELLIPNPHRIPPPGPLAGPGVPQGAEPERLPDPAGAETLASLRWPAGGAVLSRFGRRGRTHHDGIDIDGMRGDPIRAAADGRVMFSGLRGSYGRTVVLDHGGGISTLYAHAEDLSVRRGEQVSAGQKIGRVGRTGNASGSHLHFEIRLDGRPLDPLEHLPLRTARAGSAR